MNLNTYNQLFNFFIFIITGIVIGILFDIFRVIRKSFKTSNFITYIEDILFWGLAGFILLFTIFTFNNGELRIYIFAGLILGIITYILTLSKIFMRFSVTILLFVKKILYYPFYRVINSLNKFIIKPTYHIFTKLLKKIKYKPTKNKLSNICNKIDS